MRHGIGSESIRIGRRIGRQNSIGAIQRAHRVYSTIIHIIITIIGGQRARSVCPCEDGDSIGNDGAGGQGSFRMERTQSRQLRGGGALLLHDDHAEALLQHVHGICPRYHFRAGRSGNADTSVAVRIVYVSITNGAIAVVITVDIAFPTN